MSSRRPSTSLYIQGHLLESHPAAAATEALGQPSDTASGVQGEPEDEFNPDDPNSRYSIFPRFIKIFITLMIVSSSVVAPMTANIFYPLVRIIGHDIDSPAPEMVWSITIYIFMQGLSPAIFGDVGDIFGRRPAFALAFSLYVAANIVLATQQNYKALIIFRALQSLGCSGTLALGFAVMADITAGPERGRYMSFVHASLNLGPTFGPVLGRALARAWGWQAVFEVSALYVVAWLGVWIVFVPETCRAIVGNGSIRPPFWNLCVTDIIRLRCRSRQQKTKRPEKTRKIPNPFRVFCVMLRVEESVIMLMSAIIYSNFLLVATSLPRFLAEAYKLDELFISYSYIPYGIGCCCATLLQGHILDLNFRRLVRKREKRGEHDKDFPIERARTQPMFPTLTIGAAAFAGWGWAVERKASLALPLTLNFMIGMFLPASFSLLNTLIVDINKDQPATAAAANNLIRCFAGAGATMMIDPIIDMLGRAWCFTALGLAMIACFAGSAFLQIFGPLLRARKAKKITENPNGPARDGGDSEEVVDNGRMRGPAAEV